MRNPGRVPDAVKGLYKMTDANLDALVVWLEYQKGLSRAAAVKANQAVVAGGGEIMARLARYNDAAVGCIEQLIVRVDRILKANRLERSKRGANAGPAGGGRK